MWPNFLILIVGKYLDIFARESKKSTSKQLSHLHYKNLQILKITAPQFSFWFRFHSTRFDSVRVFVARHHKELCSIPSTYFLCVIIRNCVILPHQAKLEMTPISPRSPSSAAIGESVAAGTPASSTHHLPARSLSSQPPCATLLPGLVFPACR
jgi:hypothetical protein